MKIKIWFEKRIEIEADSSSEGFGIAADIANRECKELVMLWVDLTH